MVTSLELMTVASSKAIPAALRATLTSLMTETELDSPVVVEQSVGLDAGGQLIGEGKDPVNRDCVGGAGQVAVRGFKI